MVNTTQIFQNASSLNGPIEEFIESIVKCVRENRKNMENDYCSNSERIDSRGSCVPQCLLDKYCGAPTSAGQPFMNCTAKQKLLLGISALVIAMVREKYQSSQPS